MPDATLRRSWTVRPDATVLLSVALAYGLMSLLGLTFVPPGGGVAVFWPAAGLGLALFLRLPRALWPSCAAGILLGNGAANLLGGHGIVAALGFGAVNVLEPLAAALLLDRLQTRDDGAGAGVLLAVAPPVLIYAPAALLGALATVPEPLAAGALWAAWRSWFLADTVGMLAVAPLVLTLWDRGTLRRRSVTEIGEGVALVGLCAALAAVAFGLVAVPAAAQALGFALLVPVFLLGVLRLPPHGTAIVATIAAHASVWGTLRGQGPFALGGAGPEGSLLAAQAFAALMALVAVSRTPGVRAGAPVPEASSDTVAAVAPGVSSRFAGAIGLGLAYMALSELGLLWSSYGGSASPVWPAAGVALLGVLWLGAPAAVAVFAGAVGALAGSGPGLPLILALSAAGALSALVSAALLRRWLRAPWDIAGSQDLGALLGVVALGSGLAATLGMLALTWGDAVAWDVRLAVWRNWWVGDAIGMLSVTLLVVWTRAERGRLRAMAARPDGVLLGALCLGALGAGFWLNLRMEVQFFVVPGLVLSAVLFQRLGAAWAGLLTAAGLLATESAGGSVVPSQLFVLMMLATTCLLATALSERDLSQALRGAEAEARAAARRAHEAEGRLRHALAGAQAGIWQVRLHPKEVWGDDRWRELYGFDPDEPLTEAAWRARVHPEDLPRLDAAIGEALAGTATAWVQDFRILHPQRGERWLHDRVQVERDEDERPVTIGGLNLDVTDRKRAEAQVDLLLREVNHRSKNLLAVVQAVARQTARSDPEGFAERFFERLAALSASHDLLVRSEWRHIDLAELVRLQLAHFADAGGDRVRLSGPPLQLNAAAAQAIGMALHELATNAGKYGALSNATGQVRIDWAVEGRGPEARVRLGWTETGGPPVVPPGRTGFGTTVMVRMAEAAVEGSVRLDHAPEGLRWELLAPAGQVLEGPATP